MDHYVSINGHFHLGLQVPSRIRATNVRLPAHGGLKGHTSACLALLLLLAFLPSITRAERLPLKPYTTADGLPHNEINKIVRDSRGFLWFCTADGLSRFDGYTFTNFGTDQGLPHANVTDLLETRSGEYWVATYGGIVRFNPKGAPANHVVYAGEASVIAPMFTVIVPEDEDRRARSITVLLEDQKGTIWCATLKGLSKLERTNDRLALRSVDIGIPNGYPEQRFMSDLLEDRQGSLWIATPSGLYRRWPDGGTARYTKRDGLPNEYLQDLLEDDQGHLWVTTLLGGFFRLVTDATRAPPVVASTYTQREGLPSNWVYQLFETADRRFWAGTNNGLEWLSLIANTSRATVDSMSDIVWAVNPSKDRVIDLTQRMRRVADDIFTTRDIAFRFSAPDTNENQTLPAETRREVFMIFKEAVNNIARHSACARAEIELKLGGGWLELKLSDDGRGFDVAGASDGNGLASMHRRANNLGGILEIASRPGNGTTIILKAPMDGHVRRRR